ncbi:MULTISPECIES: ParB/RepB/Spo0J family partition protein [unclassified Lactobacillus]|uniref:ParB/RepB/Spo0J family partition protein n=1 Tax=unclassified Lactobacillus TaxID=2620435 RepID=UPI002269D0DF|nr:MULTISPECIES: ParB/RepB/Spo0J family partition protein [unclassified Lactobacillus]MCX8720743.1 ParB/RepB/Spo0J family partition protein [Lactobacillus sp. B4010]MCX8723546.1 ParB/RepB/Spo0J family partition protein [Lactobacillus sp. B4005]MCX8731801.1 ParB/RepB/Spo0J family partition protein [Lactobacillus sp. B4015]MCX8733925.1 ParB/RepB/Spo0J family partition protein [Lactobacillus sp. B4012]
MERDSRSKETRRKGGLGRGIEALFEDEPQIEETEEEIQDIDLSAIRPNPYQPRKNFDDKTLKELSDSIKENGVFQPIIVRKSVNGYEIIAGERRFRASKMAKKKTVPAIVRDFTESQMMEVAVLENLQREDLTPLEEAQAYEMLQKNLGLTQEEVSKRMGKSRPYIANYLRLLTLPNKTKHLLQRGELSMGQARTLLGLKNKDKIDEVAKQVVKEGMPVRKVEALVANLNAKKHRKKTVQKSAFIRESEHQLADKLGSNVNISESKKGSGRLSIGFSSVDELNRILDILGVDLDE